MLLFELADAPGVPFDDVVEVSNYVAALEHGLARLRGGFPLSSRLLREVHEHLLARGRGADKQPGEFRRSQNWIGGSLPGNAQYVPPPPLYVADCMGELERFMHMADDGLPALLYLSRYFKQHRPEYYRLLNAVRQDGDWEAWIDFYLEGVAGTAQSAVETTHRLLALFREDAARVQALGRAAANALRVFEVFRARPLANVSYLMEQTGIACPTAARAVEALTTLGIVREITDRRRNRVFAYERHLEILNEGGEP